MAVPDMEQKTQFPPSACVSFNWSSNCFNTHTHKKKIISEVPKDNSVSQHKNNFSTPGRNLLNTLNHDASVLRLGRKAVGPESCVTHVKEPTALDDKRRGFAPW